MVVHPGDVLEGLSHRGGQADLLAELFVVLRCVDFDERQRGEIAVADIPGENNYGSIVKDDPIFAEGLLQYVGQPVFAVAAESVDGARRAARRAEFDYEELTPILDPLTAVEERSFVLPTETLVRGDPDAGLESAPQRLRRRVFLGGQDQFYLEGHIAMALPSCWFTARPSTPTKCSA